ncbi:hypothetical protein B0H14DRAFT_2650596 [Mycena olivaceomarginata]|nr:hypothetical protein B0H14DRAFT_2650596 [Mycena olivaceomarginata]
MQFRLALDSCMRWGWVAFLLKGNLKFERLVVPENSGGCLGKSRGNRVWISLRRSRVIVPFTLIILTAIQRGKARVRVPPETRARQRQAKEERRNGPRIEERGDLFASQVENAVVFVGITFEFARLLELGDWEFVGQEKRHRCSLAFKLPAGFRGGINGLKAPQCGKVFNANYKGVSKSKSSKINSYHPVT